MEPRKIKIKDLKPGLVSGVEVVLPVSKPYRETYFEWTEAKLTAVFQTNQVSGGFLQAWKHHPCFTQAENHVDAEMFYFLKGTAIMMFIDYINGKPNLKTTQIVRIKPGTLLIIAKGKGHFVPVAEDDTPVSVVVVAPKMDAPRMDLSEPVVGVV